VAPASCPVARRSSLATWASRGSAAPAMVRSDGVRSARPALRTAASTGRGPAQHSHGRAAAR
jgi:hypothetical protein